MSLTVAGEMVEEMRSCGCLLQNFLWYLYVMKVAPKLLIGLYGKIIFICSMCRAKKARMLRVAHLNSKFIELT